MRTSAQIALLVVLVLSCAVSTFAQEGWLNGLDTLEDISSAKDEKLCKIFSDCLAKRLHAAVTKNGTMQVYLFCDMKSSGNTDLNTLGRATFGALAETFGKTPLGKGLVRKIAKYSRVEYAKYRSEKRGSLYILGKKPVRNGEKDYRWLLRSRVYQNSPISIELMGSFRDSNLIARFANDGVTIGLVNKQLSDFARSIFHHQNATVFLNVNYDLEGPCFARVHIYF